MTLYFDMIQTSAVAVVILLTGGLLIRRIKPLAKFCIPSPVVGGIIYALLSLAGYLSGSFTFICDFTLKDVFMTAFFTSVGYCASLSLLKSGGVKVVVFLILSITLVVCQNLLGVGLAAAFNLNPLLGLAAGSVPMVGGHGTSAAFAPLFEEAGAAGAVTLSIAAATFGLISGSMMGGPIGRRLIEKNNLLSTLTEEHILASINEDRSINASSKGFASAVYFILIAMGLGTIIASLLEKTGFTFPAYIGAMFAAAAIRNVCDLSGNLNVPMEEINDAGNICLSLFLAMALMSIQLWELATLAVPMLTMLSAQCLLMGVFSYFITFRLMGSNYDAAVISCGFCGFGLGATSNAMANMQALTARYYPSPQAFFIVPLVGSLFIDFINSTVIAVFMNLLA